MANFVLVHGAWHGGWCWWKVEPLLRQSGSRVYAPSLTGTGERSHLLRHLNPAAINLDLHIQDVGELLESEGLEGVILLGADLRNAGNDHSSVGVTHQNHPFQSLAFQKLHHILNMQVQINGSGVQVPG